MSLLQLPEELLREIANCSRPNGFESLMLSCRRLHNAGEPYLLHHNALRKEYSHLRFQRPSASDDVPMYKHPDFLDKTQPMQIALQLLHAIGRDPWIPDYITTANFRDVLMDSEQVWETEALNEPDRMWDNPRHAALKQEVEDEGHVLRLVRESRYIAHTDSDAEEWHQKILDDDFSTMLFLLTLLPSAERLTLPRDWSEFMLYYKTDGEGRARWQLLDKIVEEANSPRSTDASLGRLKIFDNCTGLGFSFEAGPDDIAPFLALKSLREMTMGSVIAAEDSDTEWVSGYAALGLNVEKLELPGCYVDARNCTRLFKNMSHLQELHISHDTKRDGIGYDWDADSFTQSLMAAVGDTLVSLSLTIKYCEGEISAIQSLRGFQRLTRLELDARLFMGPPYIAPRPDLDPYGDEEDKHPENVPRLVDVLPASLQKLSLFALASPAYNLCLDRLFQDFPVEKKLKLPELDQVAVVRGSDPMGAFGPRKKRPQLPYNVEIVRSIGLIDVSEMDGIVRSELVDELEQNEALYRQAWE